MSLATSPFLLAQEDRSLRWQELGACAELDTEIFYVGSQRGPALTAFENVAKGVCASCPVLLQCRDYALRTHEPYGIWGGLTPQDRERHYRRHR